MSHIGPEMPPHLAKRKRTPEDEHDGDGSDREASRRVRRASPPQIAKPTNDEEIALDDDSDGIHVDPVLPEALPVSVTARPRMGPSMGPTLPPSSPAPKTGSDSASGSDSDSDSDYGPALPGTDSHSEAMAAYIEEQDAQEDDDARLYGVPRPPAGPDPDAPAQRDDWMLAPPTDDVGARAADPTKIRARKFATGRAANAVEARAVGGGAAASAIGSLWTETIEQKSRRLADTVLGRAPDPTRAGPRPETQTTRSGGSASTSSRKADTREAQIMAYTEATRGRSLYETHQDSIKDGRRTGDKDEERHSEKRDRHRQRESDHSDRHRDRESSRRDRQSDGRDRESDRHRDRDSEKHRHRHDRHHRHRDGSPSTSKRKKEELDDPSARAFDREKDMSLGVQINHKQRRDLLSRASDFGGRFQKGSYL
ncbi:hypothetical protein CMQ_4154 [Grosmannia clavigera kw1407]|uniref:DUF3752 domain-containing protein n=1 Tax=Grosmannia clavigera (strain kw1407 / UAMH 11150) TaxID=655863 RepID=F0XAI5_GROCL|nr:uncharacterized protein CMQ_4154 [Grosmannia clavigera kw1407]EFX06085.1 hypothetical protein CMQ_4154 [Grosmannia clavigera kw1407]